MSLVATRQSENHPTPTPPGGIPSQEVGRGEYRQFFVLLQRDCERCGDLHQLYPLSPMRTHPEAAPELMLHALQQLAHQKSTYLDFKVARKAILYALQHSAHQKSTLLDF